VQIEQQVGKCPKQLALVSSISHSSRGHTTTACLPLAATLLSKKEASQTGVQAAVG
jgi:hypothetical protein